MSRFDWQDRALCAEVSPEFFVLDVGVPAKDAKSICARCPVTAECLLWALETDTREGVFGGLSPRERRALVAA